MSECTRKAMDYLARREHSSQQLFNKLIQKGFTTLEVESTIEWLQSQGLQSDQRFAEHYVFYRSQSGFGPLRVVAELKDYGIDASIIDMVVHQADIPWHLHLQAAWEKKYGHVERFGSKAYAAQLRFLLQRGFSSEAIHLCITTVGGD